jgi:hypothetical protein
MPCPVHFARDAPTWTSGTKSWEVQGIHVIELQKGMFPVPAFCISDHFRTF